MRTKGLVRAAVLGVTVLVTLTGCLLNRGGDDAGTSPPEGGWPRPENGQLTGAMCKLLTAKDYERAGHRLLIPLEPASGSAKPASNHVSCSAPPADGFTLVLQPTAEAAKIWYGGTLKFRKDKVADDKLESVFAEGLVQGADESWFDYWLDGGSGQLKDYELQLRRGALVVELVLSGVDAAKEKDPKGALVALATLVLDRIDDLGRADTGTTPKVRFDVKGKGRAKSIQYSVSDGPSKTLKNVKLPWSANVPTADHGNQPVSLSLTADTERTGTFLLPPPIGCSITAGGKVISENEGIGFALCNGSWTR